MYSILVHQTLSNLVERQEIQSFRNGGPFLKHIYIGFFYITNHHCYTDHIFNEQS